ncbi:MAG: FAD-dependent oxidoreductase [Candidatus Eisenbacteria bacterium]
MSEQRVDLIVIGSGPGGYVAALRAARLGLRTVLIEEAEWGGVCLNWGCIPTKALLRSAHLLQDLRAGLGVSARPEADLAAAVRRSRQVVDRLVKGVRYLLQHAGVETIAGHGQLEGLAGDGVRVRIVPGGDGGGAGRPSAPSLSSARVVLATGAQARELPALPFDGRTVLSSREALGLEEAPRRLLIVGAGAIGLEFADVFQAFGSEVAIVEMMPGALPGADPECSTELARALARRQIRVRCGTVVAAVERREEGLACLLAPAGAAGPGGSAAAPGAQASVAAGEGEPQGPGGQSIIVDRILVAAGVVPRIRDLGLDRVGLGEEGGFLPVDEHLRTRVPSIYAIGDLIGAPLLAHAASAEGIHAVEHAAGRDPVPLDHRWTPAVVFTEPAFASAGSTEAAAREEHGEVRVGRFPYRASGRALAEGSTHGFVKVILDAAGQRLLGAHVVGPGAGETIAELALIGRCGIPMREVLATVHAHPTLCEAIPEAILAARGEGIHV